MLYGRQLYVYVSVILAVHSQTTAHQLMELSVEVKHQACMRSIFTRQTGLDQKIDSTTDIPLY